MLVWGATMPVNCFHSPPTVVARVNVAGDAKMMEQTVLNCSKWYLRMSEVEKDQNIKYTKKERMRNWILITFPFVSFDISMKVIYVLGLESSAATSAWLSWPVKLSGRMVTETINVVFLCLIHIITNIVQYEQFQTIWWLFNSFRVYLLWHQAFIVHFPFRKIVSLTWDRVRTILQNANCRRTLTGYIGQLSCWWDSSNEQLWFNKRVSWLVCE
jgi:hypothetical protein